MSERRKRRTPGDVIRSRRLRLANRADALSLLLRMGFLAAALLVVFTQVFLLTPITGQDMFPSVKDGDLLLAFRLENTYRRNDVVLYQAEGTLHVGRIAAMPGETVRITEDGAFYADGMTLSGEILYPTYMSDWLEMTCEVPADSYYILGDYRTSAWDSRVCGPVQRAQLAGKVITLLRRRSL